MKKAISVACCILLCGLISLSFFYKKHNQDTASKVKELMNRQLNLSNMNFTILGKDTVLFDIDSCQYKVFTYIRQSECISCNLRLNEWKEYIKEIKRYYPNVGFVFYYPIKSKKNIIYFLESENFNYPVCIDPENHLKILETFPHDIRFQTFLLDKDNKIIAIGNPIINSSINDLFVSIIKSDLNKNR